MLNDFYYYAESGNRYNTKITIKTEEEMELFKSYISEYEVNNDKKNPAWRICFFNGCSGYDREKEQLRTKLATLRRKRGMYHHWTEEDGKRAVDRCNKALSMLCEDDIQNWKEFCIEFDRLSDYFERLIANRPEKG